MFYRPDNAAVAADVIPFFDNGEFKLFYLKDYRNIDECGEGCPWCLLETKDLVHYVDNGPVLLRGEKDEQDLYVFTGCCLKVNDEYLIYYTGHNPHLRKKGLAEQKVLLAKSKDLKKWTKVKEFVFGADEWLEMHDFRDPFVFFDDEKSEYCMLLAGRIKNENPNSTRGVTLVAYSTDLYNWEVSKDLFYAPNAYFTHECPDLFKMGDWWYLIFSEFTDKIVTTYRMSRSKFGPWITPKVNSFDGHAFYAAKSVSDGKRRVLFGWNCIKNEERDNNYWQWGGNIIPHELVQAEDGTLFVKCPEEIKNQYENLIDIQPTFSMGAIKNIENGLVVGDNGGKSVQLFNQLPANCKIELEFTSQDDIGDFGVALRCDKKMDEFYYVKFEPKFNRLAMDMQPRNNNTIHTQVDVERFCPINIGERNHMLILIQDSVLEVYVNDRVAMSSRMFDLQEGCFGLICHNTTAIFENIKLLK